MPGITQRHVTTRRRETFIRERHTDAASETVLFIHGNMSQSQVWEQHMNALPANISSLALDLRGYGKGEAPPIDATRGLADHRDDIIALLDHLDLPRVHVVGHSLGGGIAADLAIHHYQRVTSLTLIAPLAPYGFGGTDINGKPYAKDYAGTGAGTVNPAFLKHINDNDFGDNDQASPRNVVRAMYFPTRDEVTDEDLHVQAILDTRIGVDHYPGDSIASSNWPGFAPGTRGIVNAMSAKYFTWEALAETSRHVPVLWFRGDRDVIVSDTSLSDVGYLGQIGAIPGWPGEDVFGAQPMITQTRNVLQRHGNYLEVVMEGAGHFPQAQRPTEFDERLRDHIFRAVTP